MEQGNPDVLEQVPAGGNVNRPASGTYGEDAAAERLAQQLPDVDASQPAASNPTPGRPGPMPGAIGAPAPGLPQALFAPTAQPDVPVSSPLIPSGAPMAPGTPEETLILGLQLLAKDPDRTQTTRELAQMALDYIIRQAGE